MSTTDVSVELFRDNRCFERAGSTIWDTEGSCFVNVYDLEQSKAFTVAIVDSTPAGSEKIRISLWADDCMTAVSSGAKTVTATAGICSPVLGSLYGVYSVKYRNSLTPCTDAYPDCSDAKTLKITRYADETCSGVSEAVKWKSADGLCLKEGVDVERYTLDITSQTVAYELWRNANNCTADVTPDQTTESVATEDCVSAVGLSFYYSLLQAEQVPSFALATTSTLTWLSAGLLLILHTLN